MDGDTDVPPSRAGNAIASASVSVAAWFCEWNSVAEVFHLANSPPMNMSPMQTSLFPADHAEHGVIKLKITSTISTEIAHFLNPMITLLIPQQSD
jgi:hypothetical protein